MNLNVILMVVFMLASRGVSILVPSISIEDAPLSPFEAKYVKQISLGYDNLLAEIAWINYLQHADYQQKQNAKKTVNSWQYQALRSVVAFDSRFCQAYLEGGTYLTIGNNDLVGAEKIYNLAVERNGCSNLGPIYFNLGYLYLYELNDKKKAAHAYKKASEYPNAPYYLKGLASKLLSESGDLEEAKLILVDLIKRSTDENIRARYLKRLKAIIESERK